MGVVAKIKEKLFDKGRRKEVAFFEDIKERFLEGGCFPGVGRFVRLAVKRNSGYTALMCGDKTLTYNELYICSLGVARLLHKNGVKARDKVFLFCENSIEFYIFYYAIWLRGAVAVPVNTFLHEKELSHIINDSEPSAILTLSKWKEKLKPLAPDCPFITEEALSAEVPHFVEDPFVNDSLGPDELCLLLYTSGTTGVPKGVMLSSKNVITNAMQDYARLRLFSEERERFFAVLPLFHSFAQNVCMWLPMLTGSSVIVVSRIDRTQILDGLHKEPTLFFGFPALYGLLCLMKHAPLGTIKRFVSGADAMPDKIRAAFAMIYGRKILSGYGLTEASPVISINHDDENAPTDVVGRPVVGLECEIREGTLWVRGDNVMMGYYNASEETKKVLVDGWLNTGDLASVDEFGVIRILGRSKDLIIHKGFNIYPQEVENVLMSHPAVFKAAVVGRNEAVVGQVPIAFVATKEDKESVEKTLRKLCSNNLATYKIPKKIICVDDLPMSSSGKVDKKQLQGEA